MRECTRHPAESQPGGGVCASCLRERLTSLWRGESFRAGTNPVTSQPERGENGATDRTSIIVEWTAFHARRRRSLEQEVDLSKASVVMGPVERSSQLSILMSAQKLRTRSMPLDNRSAEDTASRVIREEADELYMDDLDFLEGVVSLPQESAREQRCFSHTRKSPKWVRVLISPMTTSRNRVFPSRSKEDVRKSRGGSRKRLTRFVSSDWSHNTDEASPHWIDALRTKEGLQPRTTIRSSVLSWLQDSERTKMKKYEETRQLTPSRSSSALDSGITEDTLLRDLITVGHLHEIAEEIEEEDEVLSPDSLDDVDSFGKFLLSAALRHPEAALTRISSAASS